MSRITGLLKWICQRGVNTASGDTFSMVGPVHFQPLRLELEQVKEYISGLVLNAGCGERDISDVLRTLGASEVINYDIHSSIPGAVTGSLAHTPFASAGFDTIFCNAVLEHVPDIHRVMSELTRILKPGGYLIVGMPFLQPYHQCPTDFRRYTREGLIELGELYRLQCRAILPVHTIAQTLGWIAWEWAKEKGRLRMMLVFPLIWLATRLYYRTDPALTDNANTYQAIYRKPLVSTDV